MFKNTFFYRTPPVAPVALKNFAKFTEKHLCQSLHFDEVAGGVSGRQLLVLFGKILRNTLIMVLQTKAVIRTPSNIYFLEKITIFNKYFQLFSKPSILDVDRVLNTPLRKVSKQKIQYKIFINFLFLHNHHNVSC